MSYEPELCRAKPATDLERHLEAAAKALEGQAAVCVATSLLSGVSRPFHWLGLAAYVGDAHNAVARALYELSRLLDRIDAEAAS